MDPEFQAFLASLIQRARGNPQPSAPEAAGVEQGPGAVQRFFQNLSPFSAGAEQGAQDQVMGVLSALSKDREQTEEAIGPTATNIIDIIAGGLPGGAMLAGRVAGRALKLSKPNLGTMAGYRRGNETANVMRNVNEGRPMLGTGKEKAFRVTKFVDDEPRGHVTFDTFEEATQHARDLGFETIESKVGDVDEIIERVFNPRVETVDEILERVFNPRVEVSVVPERITKAAFKLPNGDIIEGFTHADALGEAVRRGQLTQQQVRGSFVSDNLVEGFKTNRDTFVDSKEGFRRFNPNLRDVEPPISDAEFLRRTGASQEEIAQHRATGSTRIPEVAVNRGSIADQAAEARRLGQPFRPSKSVVEPDTQVWWWHEEFPGDFTPAGPGTVVRVNEKTWTVRAPNGEVRRINPEDMAGVVEDWDEGILHSFNPRVEVSVTGRSGVGAGGTSITAAEGGGVTVRAFHGTRAEELPQAARFGGLHLGTEKAATQRLANTPSCRTRGVPGNERVFEVEATLAKPFGSQSSPIDETELFKILNQPGKLDDLRAQGFDGIIYKNSVEDAGSTSVLIFDPSKARSVGRPR